MKRFPAGYLVLGDAMCSFNPIYGQGMSVASLEALALQDAVRRGTDDLPRRYFRSAAKAIGVAWRLAASSDLAFPEVQGRRTTSMRFANRLSDWVLGAAETDAVVNTQFFKVTGLIDPPARLLDPRFLSRVARVNRTRGRQDRRPVTPTSLTPTAP
jgi:2-polyprenyl-6-methoxyphenol hydroxylase-like FAD-dependent oxidoreductase